jgi:hypothetical protein
MMSERLDEDAINYLYGGDDTEISHQKIKRIRVRFKQVCCSIYHERGTLGQITAGSEAVRETALVEGKFRTAYTCLPCIEKALSELAEERHD